MNAEKIFTTVVFYLQVLNYYASISSFICCMANQYPCSRHDEHFLGNVFPLHFRAPHWMCVLRSVIGD